MKIFSLADACSSDRITVLGLAVRIKVRCIVNTLHVEKGEITKSASHLHVITGAQLRHNEFRIFADPSRIFTYNCDETFKTTSRNLSEKMPGHA